MPQHQPARALGEEADHLPLAGLPVLEHALDHAGGQRRAQRGARVLLRGQVHHHRVGVVGQPLVQVLRHGVAPPGVQVAAARVGQRGAHLQPVGLQPVQRAQRAVQARQDHHVILRPVQVGGLQRPGVQTAVHVAVEGQHRGLAVGLGGLGRPGGVAAHVQRRQRVRQFHQRGDLRRRLAAQQVDQAGGLRGERGLGGAAAHHRRHRRVVVQGLGGRDEEQHGCDYCGAAMSPAGPGSMRTGAVNGRMPIASSSAALS